MSYNSLTPQRIMIAIAVLFLVGYGAFNSRFLIKGPEIAIAGIDKESGAIKTDVRDFSLQGTAVHSSYISINNRPIMIDQSGNFNEKLLLSNGVSIIDIYARDKFGKEVRKKIDVVYTGDDGLTVASSTEIDVEQIALLAKKSAEGEVDGDEADVANMDSAPEADASSTSVSSVMSIAADSENASSSDEE